MVRKLQAALLILAFACSTCAAEAQQAQSAPQQPATQQVPAPTAAAPSSSPAPAQPAPEMKKYMLRDGADVPLKLAQDLSSKTAHEGDSVELTLAEDLKVDGVTVARAGSTAVGTVSHAKKNGMMGRGGELSLLFDYLKVGDQKIKLRGAQGKNGDDKTGATVGLVIAFGVLGFMKHGKNAEIKQGTAIKAFVSDDTWLKAAE
jgi:hypothetical protein